MKNHLPSTNRSLPIALIRAREAIMAPIREMLTDSGLTEQQWRVLRVLYENGAQDATEVSERACLLAPSLTRIVRHMCEQGLITRTQDQKDKRRQMLEITPQGQSIIDGNSAAALKIANAYRAKIGTEKYEIVLDLLEELARDDLEVET